MIREFVRKSFLEDIGRGDLLSLVYEDFGLVNAVVISKDEGVLAGEVYVKSLCNMLGVCVDFIKGDGAFIKRDDVILSVVGRLGDILKIERTALNFLMHASGIATNTALFVDALKNFGVKLLDTRKTRPNMRIFEKYAVRCGGALNHRMGLDDALIIKDTALGAINDIELFIAKAREKIPYTSTIEVECSSVESAKTAMEAKPDFIMCDNMSPSSIREVILIRDRGYPYIKIEASGNININNVCKYAKTGVDAISSGSLIHQAKWLDFTMRVLA